jgi:hypothetical protein
MTKSFVFVAILFSLFIGGATGYFVRDAQLANRKIASYTAMPAPAAGIPTVESLVPEQMSRELFVPLDCSHIIVCEAKTKDGVKVTLRTVKENGKVIVLLGDARLNWSAFVQAVKNGEIELPDRITNRYTVSD